MRIKRSTRKEKPSSRNLVIKFNGLEELNVPQITKDDNGHTSKSNVDVVAATGTDMLSGEEVKVHLTTVGKSAENEKRRSLSDFVNGTGTGIGNSKLREGGVVSFRDAWLNEESGAFVAPWCNVLAYTPEAAAEKIEQFDATSVRLYQNSSTQEYFGHVYFYETDPAKYLSGTDIESNATKIQELGLQQPGFIVRGLNANNEVVDAFMITKTYDSEARAMKSPKQIAGMINQAVENLEKYNEGQIKSHSVVPFNRLPISTSINDNNAALGHWKINNRSFNEISEEGDDIYAYPVISEFYRNPDKGDFVNSCFKISDERLDPALLGGLEYASAPVNSNETESAAPEPKPEAEEELYGDMDM